MKNILYRLLNKRGLKVEELDKDEKAQFETWNAVLSKEELTLEDVKKFCETQCDIIKGKWSNYDLENGKKAELIPYFTIYNTLLNVIDSPKATRENLEKHLNQLINQLIQ